jgi:hypothetical protein
MNSGGTLVDDARRMEVAFSLKPCVEPIDHFVPDPFAYSAPEHLSELGPDHRLHYFLVVKALPSLSVAGHGKEWFGYLFRDKETRGKERLGKKQTYVTCIAYCVGKETPGLSSVTDSRYSKFHPF